MFASRIYYENS